MRVVKTEITEMKQHCFDIEVEEVHEYLMASGLVVHNSSKAAGAPNAHYLVRELSMGKTDAGNTVDWVAMDSDILKGKYQFAWATDNYTIVDYYSVWQKHTDGGMSNDYYFDRSVDPNINASDLVLLTAHKAVRGLKSGYYTNSKTDTGGMANIKSIGCGSGGCTL